MEAIKALAQELTAKIGEVENNQDLKAEFAENNFTDQNATMEQHAFQKKLGM